jgi:hypothetical protein
MNRRDFLGLIGVGMVAPAALVSTVNQPSKLLAYPSVRHLYQRGFQEPLLAIPIPRGFELAMARARQEIREVASLRME